jgi:uncharacterized protein YjbI with pentapeptide repeats
MSNAIELEFKQNANSAYDVVFRSGLAILGATIPCFDPNPYVAYQEAYWQLYPQARIGVKEVIVQTQDDLNRIKQQLNESAANVLQMLNDCANLPQLAEIKEEIESRSENLRVTISTEYTDLRRLPLHEWSLFPKGTEVIFSGVKAKVLKRTRHPHKIRILMILGDTTGIDIEEDKKIIEKYCKTDAEPVCFLAQPDKATLKATLADPLGWDIIFFSGHSKAGKISINPTEHLTMDELKDVLKPAIAKRVQIFIFNSCDGLNLAPDLEKLNIDRLIVMRELIPDKIAQEFLKSFLEAFTGGARFDDAVKSARKDLVDFEATYPYASWLPIVIQNRLVPSPTWQSLGKIRSPYKGLEAFTEADAGKFYGREETIERYAKLVAQVPLVPIIGASGSGKSSLVQAGLIPYLKQGAPSNWQILTMRPGRNPFDALAQAIFNAERANLETIQLDVDLASDRHLLTQKLAQMRIPHRRILLFIDQFEELFTQSDDDATLQVFLQSLADAVSNAPNFVLVFTLRNDFLPTLQSDRQDKDFTGMLGRFGFQSFDGRMTDEQFKAAITKPVEKLGVEFENRLVDRLMKDVGTADGSLPLLQLVLDLLWKNVQKRQLTHECYEAIGGKDGMKTVLVKLADDVYDGFVKDNKVKEFKQVFLRLVTLGEANALNTRRIATRAEIETSRDNWREIVLPLSKARLLKTDLNEKGEEIVEVIHETLIQSWQRLAGWIEQHRHDLERIGEIEAAAIKWDKSKRSNQDLWGGKKLKDAHKFSKNRDRLLPFKVVVDDFLVAGSKQQQWDRWRLLGLGLIVPGLLLGWGTREYLIALNVKTIESIAKDKCTDQLSTSIRSLGMMRYELAKLNLKGRDLRCVTLEDANLNGAHLEYANLKSVYLKGVHLEAAHLDGSILNMADLSGAHLEGAHLKGSYLEYVNLEGAHLKDADLSGAHLKDARLEGAHFKDTRFSLAHLESAHLNDVHLEGGNLGMAHLEGAILNGAHLEGAQLSFAHLERADLNGAHLEGARLPGAHLEGTHLQSANLNGAILEDAILKGANLNGANLKGIIIEGAMSGDIHGLVKNLEQIKLAKNWNKAEYDPQLRKQLGLK